MSIAVERLLQNLEPGDVVPLDAFEEEHGPALLRILLDELDGRGLVLDSRNTLGEVEICAKCSGDGGDDKACLLCDDYGVTVNFGRGIRPFRN